MKDYVEAELEVIEFEEEDVITWSCTSDTCSTKDHITTPEVPLN